MFCPNCGTQLPNEAAFCGNCGTRINNQPAPQPYQAQPAPKKIKCPMLIGIAAAVAVVVLLLVFLGGGNGRPEAVAEKFFEAFTFFEFDELVECIHPNMVGDTDSSEYYSFFETITGRSIDELKAEAAMSRESTTIDARDCENVTDYKKEDIQEILDHYDIDEDLGDIYEVEVVMTGFRKGEEWTETEDILVAEIGGIYYIIIDVD